MACGLHLQEVEENSQAVICASLPFLSGFPASQCFDEKEEEGQNDVKISRVLVSMWMPVSLTLGGWCLLRWLLEAAGVRSPPGPSQLWGLQCRRGPVLVNLSHLWEHGLQLRDPTT